MSVKQYDPRAVTMVIGASGSQPSFDAALGAAQGSFIDLAHNGPTTTSTPGRDGHTVTLGTDRSMTVTLTLEMSSSTNDLLNAWHQELMQDRQMNARSMTIKDFSGKTLYEARKSILSTPPDDSFSTDGSGQRVWTFTLYPETDAHLGGNDL